MRTPLNDSRGTLGPWRTAELPRPRAKQPPCRGPFPVTAHATPTPAPPRSGRSRSSFATRPHDRAQMKPRPPTVLRPRRIHYQATCSGFPAAVRPIEEPTGEDWYAGCPPGRPIEALASRSVLRGAANGDSRETSAFAGDRTSNHNLVHASEDPSPVARRLNSHPADAGSVIGVESSAPQCSGVADPVARALTSHPLGLSSLTPPLRRILAPHAPLAPRLRRFSLRRASHVARRPLARRLSHPARRPSPRSLAPHTIDRRASPRHTPHAARRIPRLSHPLACRHSSPVAQRCPRRRASGNPPLPRSAAAHRAAVTPCASSTVACRPRHPPAAARRPVGRHASVTLDALPSHLDVRPTRRLRNR